MKRLLTLLLVFLLLLFLAACGGSDSGSAEESGDSSGAAGDSIQPPTGDSVWRPAGDLLAKEWYVLPGKTTTTQRIILTDDGNVTVDDETYVWKKTADDEKQLAGFLLDGTSCRYYLAVFRDSSQAVPLMALYTARNMDTIGDWKCSFVDHPMLPYVMTTWSVLDVEKNGPKKLAISESAFQMNTKKLAWKLESLEEHKAVLKVDDTYTVSVERRGKRSILTMSDGSGTENIYYSDVGGLDKNWPEYIYVEAMQELRQYEGSNASWSALGDDTRRSAALKKLYETFVQLGDYRDSRQQLARFTVLENMCTGSTVRWTDSLGNRTERVYEIMEYDSQGRIIRSCSEDAFRLYSGSTADSYNSLKSWDDMLYDYDAEGRISRIRRVNIWSQREIQKVYSVITPVYDERNLMVSATVQHGGGSTSELNYTYDDAGRLIANQWYGSMGIDRSYSYSYSYDDTGRLSQTICRYGSAGPDYPYTETRSYEYDERGYLLRTVTEYLDWDGKDGVETVTFNNTSWGHVGSATVLYEGPARPGKLSSVRMTVVYNYADIWFLD